ncbi:hypothetical protein HD597_006814 [Nonomuraea thailandensis]|uniref:Uncharacterized protein n=1 Tax=Nonomuraea thailandensis TaxID=1188745 RepID=A0A9X2GLH0_9ACTN|nr:hypothetical protein [Nonomuraea thailandensis]MCP2359794.1 hypothetical protein [Nonomuraea thailandensis]
MAVDFSHLGVTDDQARDLFKLGAAVCAAADLKFNTLWWALDHFENEDDLVETGAKVWKQIEQDGSA